MKMRECFSLPLVARQTLIHDKHGDLLAEVDLDVNPHAVIQAINMHDELSSALIDLLSLITHPSTDHDETIPEIVEAERLVSLLSGGL